MRARRWACVAVAVALAIGVAGCGSDAQDGFATPGVNNPGSREFLVTWGEPEGGADPKGVVILLHGGGWQSSEPAYRGMVQYGKTDLQPEGYATVAVGYGTGEQALPQIERVFSDAQERYPGVPISAYGQSAGGHLGLMLATREPDLACVVSIAGPTDLTSLEEQGSEGGEQLAVDAFGEDNLAEFSPALSADEIEAEVLMVMAESDELVPVEQGEEMATALPGAELIALPPGPAPFLHSGVSVGAYQQANMYQLEFLASCAQEG